MKRRSRRGSSKSSPSYELLEPRMLLAGDILVGNLNSGVAISDTATGTGHIMYSEVDVHTRFGGIPASNADHFIATRLDGVQWQFNNDVSWVDFTPVESDLLVAEVNFDSDSVMRAEVSGPQSRYGWNDDIPGIVQSIDSGFIGEDLRFAPNRFDGAVDEGEIQVLGSSFSRNVFFSDHSLSEQRISEIGVAALRYESVTYDFPRAASYAADGSPLLSWRVHLLPFMGLQNLYDQFNLEEPWDSATNLPLASQMPDAYSSPHFSSTTETSFLAVTGSGTIFPEFAPELGYESITDGSHTTVMFVEADADHKVVWTKPGDLAFDPADPLAGLGNIASEGFAVFTADNQAYTIPATIDPQNFANLAIRNDGNFVDFSEFGPYTSSHDSLRQLALSLLNFESTHQHFPAHAIYSDDGATPLLSWRVQILPFIEHNDLYEQFHLDEPWDSPHNLSLLPLMPQVFAHPNIANGMTNYLGVSGPGTFFELTDREIGFGSLTDGSSNTVMLVEANVDQAVEWTRPQDWVADFADPTAGLGELVPDGFNVSFGDGSILFVDNEISDVDFGKMLTRDGGEVANFEFVQDANGVEEKLRQLALATHNYESANMRFPKHGTYSDDGAPLLSWRVQILPFIEQTALYDMFHHDEPWDSPHNLSLLPLMPEIFETEGVANGFTVLQGSNGPDTMFPLEDRDLGFGQITDGTVNTILFMQVDADRAIQWTRPLDLPFDPANPSDGLGGDLESGFHFVTADGSNHFYNNALDKAPLEHLLQRNDGVPFAPEYVEETTLLRRSTEIQNNLRQLSLAALNYESANLRLPPHAIYSPRSPSGTPTLSWRVELLPFLEHGDLYDMFRQDEPWDSPHNLSLLPLMPDVFAHPLVENGMTLFQAVTTPFNDGNPESTVPNSLSEFQLTFDSRW